MAYKIPREAWRITEIKVRRYPENKAEYDNAVDELMHCHSENDGQPKGSDLGRPVENVAIKLADNPRLQRIKREMDAVEDVYNGMTPDHQRVIRVRFWSYRCHNMTYFDMERCTSYSERQMRRVVAKFIRDVGKKLGEI